VEISQAIAIISCLADGVDPYTGEVLEDSPFQHADTVRALVLAVKALERMEARESRIQRLPQNAGNTWHPEEQERLLKRFEEGVPIKELAKEHGRTEGAIRSRLMKLGKLVE